MRALLLALMALLIAAPMAVAQEKSQTETKTATSPGGEVKAELSYVKADEFRYRDVRIRLSRGGQVLLDTEVPAPCSPAEFCPVSSSASSKT